MTISKPWQRAIGLGIGVLADRFFADPLTKYHPVAWFGRIATNLEDKTWADNVSAGAKQVGILIAPLLVAGALAEKSRHRILWTALATWVSLGARSLVKEGNKMAALLKQGDIESARGELMNLCGRDPSNLDEPELARAVVESLAENTADSAVATLFWGAVGGVPGMLGHRACNTLDAMIGHKNDRYLNFGKVAARLDDLLDWLPARITGSLACLAAPAVGGKVKEAFRIMFRDGANHPSPNGGWCEAAFAGALGVQLGGTNIYPGNRTEQRGLLGDGPRPTSAEISKASRLVEIITVVSAAIAILGVILCDLSGSSK